MNANDQILVITKRMKRRQRTFWINQHRDEQEIFRLQRVAQRETLKEFIGKNVVLSDASIEPRRLRAHRGKLATLERVGRTRCSIVFARDEGWTVPMDWVVPATEDAIKKSQDTVADDVSDILSFI